MKHTGIAQKLREIINKHGTTFGTTESGSDWVIKALHPSDPLTEVRGIPDQDACPTAFLNYQSTYSLTPPSGLTSPWSFDATVTPHPISFMQLNPSFASTPVACLNSQILGSTHQSKYQNFLELAHEWRLAYMSVTVYQDGPDLANQGTLVAAQAPLHPTLAQYPCFAITPVSGTFIAVASPHLVTFSTSDLPNFENMQTIPNAYFNKSKEGCYMPMKLTKTHQQWHSRMDQCVVARVPLPDALDNQGFNPIGVAPTVVTWPYYGLGAAWGNFSPGEGPTGYGGDVTSMLCNELVGLISARNLSPQTSFSFFVRAGYEIRVQPGSQYTTHLKLSPPHDPLALEMYFKVARELKDAYPADHNDLGKIWDVISGAAKTVGGVLRAVPGPIGLVGSVLSSVAGGGDAIKQLVSAAGRVSSDKQVGKVASQADIEKLRSTIAKGREGKVVVQRAAAQSSRDVPGKPKGKRGRNGKGKK